MNVIEKVKEFMIEQKYIKPDQEIKNSDSLLEQGIIDSLGIQNLVSFLEKTYSINVDEDDLMPDNFDSFEAIADYVDSKKS